MRRMIVLTALLVFVVEPFARAEPFDLIRPVRAPILRHFEPPPTPYAAGHRGIDLGAPLGTDVVAAAGGIVAFAGPVAGDLFVSIDHPNGLRTTYSFLQVTLVVKGEAVEQGDLIARSGGCHAGTPDPCLHFGLRRGDEYLDPEPSLLDHLRRNVWEVIRLTG